MTPAQQPRLEPFLICLSFGSGCAALVYEIVWLQLMGLVVGSSAVSLGVLLGTFMGGLCLGSIAAPRVISARHHPLRVYALLEAAIGLIAIALILGLPSVGDLYASRATPGLVGILLRGLLCAALMLPPTILMGATLPAIARWLDASPRGVSGIGLIYAANIAGGVFGCLLAGFYLLRVHDMMIATLAAAFLNATVALSALFMAAGTAPRSRPVQSMPHADPAAAAPSAVYVTIALSGLTALGAEVVWTRLLSMLLGATVYTFSIILAVFLAGLGIGSAAGAYLARVTLRPREALGMCQLLLVAAIAWTAYTVNASLPYWPINPLLAPSPWFNFQIDLVRCLWAVLPAACLWGASFPLALSAAADGRDPARLVGAVYAANTIGAIAGSLAFSIVIIPLMGTRDAQRLLIGLSLVGGLIMLAPALRPLWRAPSTAEPPPSRPALAAATAIAISPFVGAAMIYGMPDVPIELIAYGRKLLTLPVPQTLYRGEGVNASVAVTEREGVRSFHVSGKIEASTLPADMRLQRMLGHLSALLHPAPRSVLVVGFGAGVTAGTFTLHPRVERIVICEIEPLIPRNVARFFTTENYDLLNDPRVEVIYDDARHYMLTTKEKFDVITSDPIHPWVKGAATLYTREYFELAKRHLAPGGVITQWVPLYESAPEVVKSEFATFLRSFPEALVWGNEGDGGGYDLVLSARLERSPIDVDSLAQRLGSAEHARVMKSLRDVEFPSAVDLLATYAGRVADLAPWLADAESNTDRSLRLQYLAGMGLNLHRGPHIYKEILSYRRLSDETFAGSPASRRSLSRAIDGQPTPP